MDSRNTSNSARLGQPESAASRLRSSQGQGNLPQPDSRVSNTTVGRATSLGEVATTDRYAPYMSQAPSVNRSVALPNRAENDL